MAHFTSVFLSSTAKDLQPWRDAVADAIRKMPGFHCERMENFGAADAEPIEVCRRRVAECDVFVGLVGHLYGSRPEGSELSFTQMEYEAAKEASKPRLVFVADDSYLPAGLGQEPEGALKRQCAFREQVKKERLAEFFHDPKDLALSVVIALQAQQRKTQRELPRENDVGGTAPRRPVATLSAAEIETLRRRRQRQFCQGLASDLASLAKSENWNDQSFTDLEAEVEAEGAYYPNALRRLLRWPAKGPRLVSSLTETIEKSAEQAALVVGEPGSGKSVALRHVAQQLAERGPRVPLYLNLKEMKTPPGAPVNADTIKQFVLDNIRPGDTELTGYLRENWDDFRNRGIWFFLFDSFDEIPAVLHAPSGSKVIQEHAQAIRQFLSGMSACRGVLASREFKGPAFLPWPKFRLLPLSTERQEQLVASSNLDPTQRLLVREYLATSQSSLLGSNPLFLTLLCQYIHDKGRAPANDYDLLSEHIRRLAERHSEDAQRTFSLTVDELMAGAERLAVLFAQAPGIGLAPTLGEIRAELRPGEMSSRELQNLLAALVDVKIGRSDVREARVGDRRFTFSHRRYQEALFAGYLAFHPNHISPRELLTDPLWREYTVTLLQTRDVEALEPLVDEAVLLLSEMAGSQRREPVIQELNSHLTYFRWDDEPLGDLLALLEQGLARRQPVLWQRLSAEAGRVLESRWNEGDLYDRLQVLEVGGLLPTEALAEHIYYAVKLDADRLQSAAFRKVGALWEIPQHLAKWVRERLADGLLGAEGRLVGPRRLEALAARLPASVGARAVVSRCFLLRKITTPLWLTAFPLAFLNTKVVFALPLMIPTCMVAASRNTRLRMVSLAATIYALMAPRLPFLVDQRAIKNRIKLPVTVGEIMIAWLFVAFALYSLRSKGPLWAQRSFRRASWSREDTNGVLLLVILYGPGLFLCGLLSTLHLHYAFADVILYSLYIPIFGFFAMTFRRVRMAKNHRMNLLRSGMPDVLVLLGQARAGFQSPLWTDDSLQELDEARLRSLSRLALDSSLSADKGSRKCAALEGLLVSIDRRLGVLQRLREHEWPSIADQPLEAQKLEGPRPG
jgi:hypothetical protein